MSRYHAASQRIGTTLFNIPTKGPYKVYVPSQDKGHGGPIHVHVRRRKGTRGAARIILEKNNGGWSAVIDNPGRFTLRELEPTRKEIEKNGDDIQRLWDKHGFSPRPRP